MNWEKAVEVKNKVDTVLYTEQLLSNSNTWKQKVNDLFDGCPKIHNYTVELNIGEAVKHAIADTLGTVYKDSMKEMGAEFKED